MKGILEDYVSQQKPMPNRANFPPGYPDALRMLPSRHRVNAAIITLLDQRSEIHLSPEDKARIVHIFGRDAGAAEHYLLLCHFPSAAAVRTAWISQLLAMHSDIS